MVSELQKLVAKSTNPNYIDESALSRLILSSIVNKKRQLSYDNIPQQWIDARTDNGGMMSPEDMMRFVNSQADPIALYKKGESAGAPIGMDYPTVAFNYSPNKHRDKQYVMVSNADSIKYNLKDAKKMSPEEVEGVRVHEDAHGADPRMNPEKANSFPNHGFTTYAGLSGNVLQREFPAILAEEAYWRDLQRLKKNKKKR